MRSAVRMGVVCDDVDVGIDDDEEEEEEEGEEEEELVRFEP